MTDQTMRTRLQRHFEVAAEAMSQVAASKADALLTAVELLTQTFQSGGKLLICGNGGSAADAQHLAAEFVSRLTKEFERPGLPAIALTTDSSFLTAYANDCGFEGVFERQVQALGKPGDLLIGISTSGNSPNVIRAVEYARSYGIHTVGLLGEGGALTGLVDCAIVVPSRSTQVVQECLLPVEHILCELVERQLFAPAPLPAFPTTRFAERLRLSAGLLFASPSLAAAPITPPGTAITAAPYWSPP
jgi:D-sedoheptulose 7-phosphate isomerase